MNAAKTEKAPANAGAQCLTQNTREGREEWRQTGGTIAAGTDASVNDALNLCNILILFFFI